MNLTELLITGYDGDKAVFAMTLMPDKANVVLTSGETVVDSTQQRTTGAFTEIHELLDAFTCRST